MEKETLGLRAHELTHTGRVSGAPKRQALQQNVFLVTNFSEEKYFVIENLHLVTKFEFRH